MTNKEYVKKALEETIIFVESRGYGGVANIMHDALELLKEQEVKTGHWIDTTKVFSFPRVQCSVCGSEQGAMWMYYCPICGAKMQEDGEV